MPGGVGPVLQFFGTVCSIFLGGTLAISTAVKIVNAVGEENKKKIAPRCNICSGTGFYLCKLCKGVSTISWSPLYDPVAINPCVCPTCDGNRVQRCLNCLSKGYTV